jgi:hypothetical protein
MASIPGNPQMIGCVLKQIEAMGALDNIVLMFLADQ